MAGVSNIAVVLGHDPSVLEQVTPFIAIGVAVIALAGVALGQWMTRRAWLRDRRLQAYTNLLDASHAAWFAVSAMYIAPWDEHVSMLPGLHQATIQVGRCASAIRLLGPQRVVDAAERWQLAHVAINKIPCDHQLWLQACNKHGDELSATPEGIEIAQAETAFVQASGGVIQ